MGNCCGSGSSTQTKAVDRQSAYTETKHETKSELTPLRAVLHSDVIMDIIVTDNASETVSCGVDKSIVHFNWKTGEIVSKWKQPQTVSRLAFAPTLRGFFTASRDQCIYQYALGAAEPVQILKGHTQPVADVTVNDDNSMLCSGSRDYSVRFWDTATAKEIRASADNLNVVTAVKWIPGETIVVQTSEDLTLRLWDSRTQSVVQRFSTDRYFPLGCDISPDGLTIATSVNGFDSDGCEIKLWDRRKGDCLNTLKGHSQAAYDCAYLPANREGKVYLSSCSKDRSLKLWDVEGGSCVTTATIPDTSASEIRCIAYARDSRNPTQVYTGCGAGVVHSWHVQDGGAVQCVAATSPQPAEA